MLMTDMNQTYLIMTTEMKRAEMKLRLNEIRERSKLLLKKHSWKKYFLDDDYLNESCWNSSSGCSSMVMTSNKEGCILTTKENNFSKLFSAIDFDFSSNNEYDEESNSVISTVKSSPTINNNNNNNQTMPVYDLSKIVFDASTLIASQSSM